ncbi:5-methyltetrahydropteroyltriglutamate--homocysteine S-methyltransferase [Nonomuraea antimicrobica]|uniref:5-methyltetrahydropteroyltriglutamate--homocysteine S-methyltransferase n=1 Tax=Nonomuraea antimicrobica TaxID=561173 RepID=A0ABP7C890_9ACTN
MSSFPTSTVLGYPRIGPDRELKRALEAYWDGRSTRAELERVGAELRARTWRRLAELGLEGLPSNTFSVYDQVLDTSVLLGAVPSRYRDAADPYFAMARGTEGRAPLRMTKWFDTNYHYLVPEIGPETEFRLDAGKPLGEVREARALGYETRPVVLGPVTYLLLGSALDRLDEVLGCYAELLSALAAEGVAWVQLDEPALVGDRTASELAAVRTAYERLGSMGARPGLFVASYFGSLGEALPVLAGTPVEAIGLDLVRGPVPETDLTGKTVVAGVVSGRDVWRTSPGRALAALAAVRASRVVVSTSCSLQHVPYSVAAEPELEPGVRARLAFAEEKVAEVVALAGADFLSPGFENAGYEVTGSEVAGFGGTDSEVAGFEGDGFGGDVPVGRPSVALPGPVVAGERSPYAVRAAAQAEHLSLPPLPVTTIGSFPQTGELRAARAAVASGTLSQAGYEHRVEAEIERVIRLQERLGLDVLVHGEPERNDMVQYFAEHLDGFAVTRLGWVQSYGSRCTRPPILYGDVSRPSPITARWAAHAQSLTDKPVKGMLTGPVTIVAWSFVRDDLPLRDVVLQVADAVRQEVRDLEAAGVSIIQVDEPALRELLPLRRAAQADYLEWAVAAYRRATSGAGDRTQIHTHLCYSDADQILDAIDGLDADVTTIESARSGARILGAVSAFGRGLGPGVYDIHSPRVPSAEEVESLVRRTVAALPVERVWVNPDCGLKTRTYEQVEASLANVVTAARRLRDELGA